MATTGVYKDEIEVPEKAIQIVDGVVIAGKFTEVAQWQLPSLRCSGTNWCKSKRECAAWGK